MILVTDAQRNSRKVLAQLEHLFDWAANRSKPMPASDLAIIRSQVTESLELLVNRADSLERAPLLLEVLEGEDGNKTVIIDMRDGTTRRFQTRVDWFEKSPVISAPTPPELADLRDRYDEQASLVAEMAKKAEGSLRRIEELEESLVVAEDGVIGVRDEMLAAAAEHRAEMTAVEEKWAGKMRTVLDDMDRLRAENWAATRVIDESLPAIAELLAERSAENAKLRAELEGLR